MLSSAGWGSKEKGKCFYHSITIAAVPGLLWLCVKAVAEASGTKVKARPGAQRPIVTFGVWIQTRSSSMGLQGAFFMVGPMAVQLLWLQRLLLPFWLGLRRRVSHLSEV